MRALSEKAVCSGVITSVTYCYKISLVMTAQIK